MATPSNIPFLETIRKSRGFTLGVVLVLLVAAGLLRLVGLESNPPGLWQDEASSGLDAFLLWTTGKDRSGSFLPLISRSFGDYPLAGYRYLTAPIVGTFGLTIGNERLVAALTGTWMVLATYWVVVQRVGRGPAVFAMTSAVLTPTWLHFSRYGSEAILLPACLVTGWALMDWGRDPRRRVGLWLGAAALAFSAYTYHAVKLILPLWMLGYLFVLQWPLIRELWRSERRHVVGPAILFAALTLPSVQAALTTGGMARGQTVLAWYHFEGITLFRLVLGNYLSYFDPGMLFVRGGPAVAQSIPGLGMWNMIELPFMLVGFATAFTRRQTRRYAAFVVFWFLLGPLPGGMTYETHNMGRAIAWLPAPQIISGWGAWVIIRGAYRLLSSPRGLPRRLLGGATLVAILAAWGVTGYAVYWCTMVRYPLVAQRDWQFEISRSMQCALRERTTERLIISPHFQMAQIFAEFHFADADRGPEGPIWQLGDRRQVQPGELYVFPTRSALPAGREVCRVVHGPTNKPYAFVYAAPEGPPASQPATEPAAKGPAALAPTLQIPPTAARRPTPQLNLPPPVQARPPQK